MKYGTIKIRPGVDAGTLALLDSSEKPAQELVLNNLGGNTTVWPDALRECHGVLADGVEDEWYEYLPKSYDPAKPTPLVISLHGGGQHGWGQCLGTAWQFVAEREGILLAFPTASSENRRWMINRDGPEIDRAGNHDRHFRRALLDHLCGKYSVDKTRIFLCGMSMGDLMTSQFARAYGDLLAGVANAEGTANTRVLFHEDGTLSENVGPVPVWQSRGELDNLTIYPDYTRGQTNAANRKYWLQINGCEEIPQLCIENENNFAFYRGTGADFVYRDVKRRNHGQTFDDADYIWRYFFSGLARVNGKIRCGKSQEASRGDAAAHAFCAGSRYAYTATELVKMDTEAFFCEDEDRNFLTGEVRAVFRRLFIPVTALAPLFGASVELQDEGRKAWVTLKDGRVLQLAQNIAAVTLDDRVYAMPHQAVSRDGLLCLPVEWFATRVLGQYTTGCKNSVYLSDHYGEMTPDMADLIAEILG